MVEADLIEPLCSLLEDDESNVKIEAAWALFNGINGYEYGQIDVYPSKNEKKPHARYVYMYNCVFQILALPLGN